MQSKSMSQVVEGAGQREVLGLGLTGVSQGRAGNIKEIVSDWLICSEQLRWALTCWGTLISLVPGTWRWDD